MGYAWCSQESQDSSANDGPKYLEGDRKIGAKHLPLAG